MKREILTPSRCREDLKNNYKLSGYAVAYIIASGLIFVITLAFIVAGMQVDPERQDLYTFCIFGGYIVCAGLFVWWYYSRPRKVDRMVLEIVEDKMITDRIEEIYRYRNGHRRKVDEAYVVVFRYFGDYIIPDRPHYLWSKQFSAYRDKELFKRCQAGDTFYIVLNGKSKRKRPLLVYNTKEFVFCPDGTPESPDSTWRDSVSAE